MSLEIHGHNMAEVLDALDLADEIHGRPTVIIARTTKGKGVSFHGECAPVARRHSQ